jgi:hypothetical protein
MNQTRIKIVKTFHIANLNHWAFIPQVDVFKVGLQSTHTVRSSRQVAQASSCHYKTVFTLQNIYIDPGQQFFEGGLDMTSASQTYTVSKQSGVDIRAKIMSLEVHLGTTSVV